NEKWYVNRPWLEYSVKADKGFCFPCRMYACLDNTGGMVADMFFFIKSGFCNWKNALSQGNGFIKHENSLVHLNAMVDWTAARTREATGATIAALVSSAQIERNRYYLKTLAKIIQFAVINELHLREDQDIINFKDLDLTLNNSSGIFINLIKFTAGQDPKFKDALKTIPKNAKYTSAEIQNETIDIMKNMVLKDIVEDIQKNGDVKFFCLKCDTTRDAVNVENLSTVLCYSVDGEAKERLIGVAQLHGLTAEDIAQQILKDLQELGLDPQDTLCSCFDGAKVMSGCKGGVQKLLQEKLNKEIPYTHCLNHQLHLVVTHVCEKSSGVADMFSNCNSLYKFFVA
uniref:TTF-type domain-containing protein n=1 Tax=Latimeria chalumnae TaxID=7897 RepID=H3ADQ8_LATCH